jgi:hypothetical protein
MSLTIHHDLIQGSTDWLQARLGLLTASEVKLLCNYIPPQTVQRYLIGQPRPGKVSEARLKVFDWKFSDIPLSIAEIAAGSAVSEALVRSMIRDGEITAVSVTIPAQVPPLDNEKTRAHLYELAAQRISQYVEPHYVSDDMLRGHDEEQLAVELYHAKYAPVTQIGFMTRDFGGFQIGYSPDGLVGEDGLIEVKSRRQKFQVQTIIECISTQTIMPEYVMQAQTGLLVSGRKWLDHITYSGGLPMAVIRVFPDPAIQSAILTAATQFEAQIAEKIATYHANSAGLFPTERVIVQEMFV